MRDALTQTQNIARLESDYASQFSDVLQLARTICKDQMDLISYDLSSIDLNEEDLVLVEQITQKIRSAFDPTKSAYTGDYSDGFFMKYRFENDPTLEAIYLNLCKAIARYIVINFKILGLDSKEIESRLKFEFNSDEVHDNYGRNNYRSLEFGAVITYKDSNELKFRISLQYFLLLKDLYFYIKEATSTKDEFDDVRIKECSFAIDYLYKLMIGTISHEIYHVAQRIKGITYPDDTDDEMSTIEYLLSLREATACEYEELVTSAIIRAENL